MKTLFSGVQPSGAMHIGNYLGAIKNWAALQDEYKSIFCIVDMHAITGDFDPEELKERVLNASITYLACGINPKKSFIFIQSQVPEHAELAWILGAITPFGNLGQMTQFKEKSRGKKTFSAGLLNYPVLQAADILLYKTNLVPVGEDQKQHLEFSRDTAIRFNNRFGETFIVPEVFSIKETSRIMALDNPLIKMSKSASSKYNYISLLDAPEIIKDKIKKSVTDSGKEIVYDKENKPAISNMLNIMYGVTGVNIKELEKKYEGKSYMEFKNDLAEELIKFLTPIQEKHDYYKKHEKEVYDILEEGRCGAKEIAEKTMEEVKTKIGFI